MLKEKNSVKRYGTVVYDEYWGVFIQPDECVRGIVSFSGQGDKFELPVGLVVGDRVWYIVQRNSQEFTSSFGKLGDDWCEQARMWISELIYNIPLFEETGEWKYSGSSHVALICFKNITQVFPVTPEKIGLSWAYVDKLEKRLYAAEVEKIIGTYDSNHFDQPSYERLLKVMEKSGKRYRSDGKLRKKLKRMKKTAYLISAKAVLRNTARNPKIDLIKKYLKIAKSDLSDIGVIYVRSHSFGFSSVRFAPGVGYNSL